MSKWEEEKRGMKERSKKRENGQMGGREGMNERKSKEKREWRKSKGKRE